jgi:circadian clock protein KaiB
MESDDLQVYKLKLFIAGVNPTSIKAIENIRSLCNEYLDGKHELEVFDIYQQRQLLKDMDIIAVPTLIRESPQPEKRIIGDMTDIDNIIRVLELNKGRNLK